MTALIRRLRRWARFPRDEYALSPATASGRMRGRPTGPRTQYLLQGGDELRAVRCLACGQDERQRAALAVGGEVDLAGLPASGTSEEDGLQPEFPPTPDASSFFQRGITFGLLPVLLFEAAPFDPAFPSSAAAFFRAVTTPSSRCIPAASWWARAVVGSGGGGVDAEQGQVHLTPLRGFRDQALQQGLEDADVTPLPEAVVDGRPGAELRRHLPPLPVVLNRQITPSNCCRSHSGYGPYSPIGRYGSMNSQSGSVSCTRVT